MSGTDLCGAKNEDRNFAPAHVTEIWDLHCHLSGVPGNTPEARLGKLLEYADRMGIARLCVFMGSCDLPEAN